MIFPDHKRHKIAFGALSLVFFFPLQAGAPAPVAPEIPIVGADNTHYRVYREIILEDFEKTNYTTDNSFVRRAGDGRLKVDIRTTSANPAPVPASKRHLQVRVDGFLRGEVQIRPPKPPRVSQYIHSISLWAWGNQSSGYWYIILRNNYGYIQKFKLGDLKYSGWKKLTVTVGAKIKQMDMTLNKKSYWEVLRLGYVPARGSGTAQPWQLLSIDDLSVVVRPKYLDKPIREWK